MNQKQDIPVISLITCNPDGSVFKDIGYTTDEDNLFVTFHVKAYGHEIREFHASDVIPLEGDKEYELSMLKKVSKFIWDRESNSITIQFESEL